MRQKSIVILFGILGLTNFGLSQDHNSMPLQVSYFGHYVFHPGVKIGTEYSFKSWEKRKGRKHVFTKKKSLFISPQVGFYVHPKNHSAFLANSEVGYNRVKDKRNTFISYSFGLGYLTQFNAGATYFENENGEIRTKKIGAKGYFFPTINFGFGKYFSEQFAVFSKLSLGTKVGYNTSGSIDPILELGIKHSFK